MLLKLFYSVAPLLMKKYYSVMDITNNHNDIIFLSFSASFSAIFLIVICGLLSRLSHIYYAVYGPAVMVYQF